MSLVARPDGVCPRVLPGVIDRSPDGRTKRHTWQGSGSTSGVEQISDVTCDGSIA
jgi:hypothetical protein